ncbi:MAG: SRPBCC family protein [Actinomycetota bacterium]
MSGLVLYSVDEVYVDAPPQAVYDVLVKPAEYSSWWPAGAGEGGTVEVGTMFRLHVRPPGFLRRRQRFEVNVTGMRPGAGFEVRYAGCLTGRSEWYLEPFKQGTVIHYFIDVEVGDERLRRLQKRIIRHRFAIKRGMNGLKDRLEAGS